MISFANFKGDEKIIEDIKTQAEKLLGLIRDKHCFLVKEHFKDYRRVESKVIEGSLIKRFKAAGNTEAKLPVIYLICKSQEQTNPIIIAWGLFIIIKSDWDQHHDGIMRKICRYFRQLDTGDSKQLSKLSKIIAGSESVESGFISIETEMINLLEDPGLKKIYNMYRAIYSIYKSVMGLSINHIKNKSTTVRSESSEFHGLPSVCLVPEAIDRHHYTNAEEHRADQSKTKTVFFEFPQNKSNQRHLYQQAIAIKSRKTIAENSPVCAINQGTIDEVKYIIKFCRMDDSAEALVVMLAIILGKSVSEVLSFNFSDRFIKRNMDFPKHKNNTSLGKSLQCSVSKRYWLMLPEEVWKRLEVTDIKRLEAETVYKYIKKNIPLKKSALKNFQWFWLKRNGFDISYRELLSSRNVKQPQSYYTTIAASSLESAWKSYLHDLGFEIASFNPSDKVGSLLNISHGYIKEFYYWLKQDIYASINERDFLGALNSDSIFLHHLLIIATGHRPCIDSFCSTNHFSKATLSIWLADKASNGKSNPRIVGVPEIVFLQLEDYLNLLEFAQRYYSADQPDLSETLKNRIEGTENLIQFINPNFDSSLLTPRFLHYYLSEIWPVPLNWNRHTLRSYFVKRGLGQYEIDFFMGHQFTPYHRLGKFGGVSFSTTISMRKELDNLFKELDITFTPFSKEVKNAT